MNPIVPEIFKNVGWIIIVSPIYDDFFPRHQFKANNFGWYFHQ